MSEPDVLTAEISQHLLSDKQKVTHTTALGVEIDRRNVTIAGMDNIKEAGIYDASVKFYKDIKADFKVEVVGDGTETAEESAPAAETPAAE